MEFEACLKKQLSLHPVFEAQDALKLCYQAAFGAEHLVADVRTARRLFDAEYAATPAAICPLVEPLCPEFARVNLGVWKGNALSPSRLFNLFLSTASQSVSDGETRLLHYTGHIGALVQAGGLSFSPAEWHRTLQAWRSGGGGPVHHSVAYRAHEKPAYRVVSIALLEKKWPYTAPTAPKSSTPHG